MDDMQFPEEKKYKVIVVGDAGTGKTALTYRFCENKYCEEKVTIGVDICEKTLRIYNENVTLQIWDTAGMEKNNRALSTHYYRDVHAVVLAYDVTRKSTFDNLFSWLHDIKREVSDDVIIFVVGTKCDEPAVINQQQAQRFADRYKLPVFQTSAKLDQEKENINCIFFMLACKLTANAKLIVNHDAIQLQLQGTDRTDFTDKQSSCWCW